jgi:hypothetical protein
LRFRITAVSRSAATRSVVLGNVRRFTRIDAAVLATPWRFTTPLYIARIRRAALLAAAAPGSNVSAPAVTARATANEIQRQRARTGASRCCPARNRRAPRGAGTAWDAAVNTCNLPRNRPFPTAASDSRSTSDVSAGGRSSE